jgi:crossover junction endodeoxyribonuclease RuvC
MISCYAPDAAAVEGIFYCRNVKTAVLLGEARGVVVSVCARAGLPVFEYSPRRVKQALVGRGEAAKEQVASMVVRLLGLKEIPQEDSADALAIAICHAHARTIIDALSPKAI